MTTHRATISFSITAALLAIGITAALAEQAPQGSYEKTCSNISVSGTTLNANCKTFSGQSVETNLPYYASCVGDIGNINGTLACAGPSGSYALTCRDAVVKGDILSAQCRKINGQYEETSLKGFQGFQGNINNCDGKLRNGSC
jgi:hypothetical protein